MNIKYISLLSLFCSVASVDAWPVAKETHKKNFNREESVFKRIGPAYSERIEQTKKELNSCRKAFPQEGDCNSQEMDYQNAKNDLLEICLAATAKEQIKYNKIEPECSGWARLYTNCLDEKVHTIMQNHMYYRSIIVMMKKEKFDDDYLANDQPFEEFVDTKSQRLNVLRDKDDLLPHKNHKVE